MNEKAKPFLRVKNWADHHPNWNPTGKAAAAYLPLKMSLVTDPEFMSLSSDRKWTLILFWMLTMQYGNGRLPNNVSHLCLMMPLDPERVEPDLTALIEDGWIIPCTKDEADSYNTKAKKTSGPYPEDAPDLPDDTPPEMLADMKKVVNLWSELGITPIFAGKLRPKTKRFKCLRARIKEYGLDVVLDMVRRRAASSFLCNPPQSEKHPDFKATFEWCVWPSNFDKIIEGNYDNAKKQEGANTLTGVSDLLWAGWCADRRGINPERIPREKLFEMYNADVKVCRDYAEDQEFDVAGMTPNDLFRWYKAETGRWPHEG
jgi:hypothetical protein